MTLTEAELRERFPNASEAFLRANNLPTAGASVGRAYSAIGDSRRDCTIPKKRIRQSAKPKGQSESREQRDLIKWWDTVGASRHGLEPNDLKAFPLQGARTARNGARMKAEGMRAGTPDLHLAVPAGDYHGLWIELKAGKGRASPAQKAAMERLNRRGYLAVLCVGREEAQATIEEYLKWRVD